MLNIGKNPTIANEKNIKIEVHLFDFNENIYGEVLEVNFVKRLRDEFKFNSVEELKQQLSKDKINAETILN